MLCITQTELQILSSSLLRGRYKLFLLGLTHLICQFIFKNTQFNFLLLVTLISAKNNLTEILGILRNTCKVYAGDPWRGLPLSEVSGKQFQYNHSSGDVNTCSMFPLDCIKTRTEFNACLSYHRLQVRRFFTENAKRKQYYRRCYNSDHNKNWMKATSHWRENTHLTLLSRGNIHQMEQSQLIGIYTWCKSKCHSVPDSQTLRRKAHQRKAEIRGSEINPFDNFGGVTEEKS